MSVFVGDNVIDQEEYRKAYSEFGVSGEQCDKAYNIFTKVCSYRKSI